VGLSSNRIGLSLQFPVRDDHKDVVRVIKPTRQATAAHPSLECTAAVSRGWCRRKHGCNCWRVDSLDLLGVIHHGLGTRPVDEPLSTLLATRTAPRYYVAQVLHRRRWWTRRLARGRDVLALAVVLAWIDYSRFWQ
jgi:hypothetical protein